MKRLLIASLILAAGSAFGQVSIGVSIGAPPPPRVLAVRPVAPGPGFMWVDGYWYPNGRHWKWHDGYWTRAPYSGAHWIAPRYENRQFFNGFWEGDRGRVNHEHKWDKNRDRDYNRFKDHDHHDNH